MFDSLEDFSAKLSATGYFIDPVMTKVVFLAAKLQKPLILEGPAGSGKTQLALAVAQAENTHIERLQCYEGLTDKQAIGEFDEGLQRLYMEFCKGQGLGWHEIVQTLKGRDFFRPGPLMRALECERPCVLLIDEIDKVDEASDAYHLSMELGGCVGSTAGDNLGFSLWSRMVDADVETASPDRIPKVALFSARLLLSSNSG
jgi:MoxR-like ATPase